MRHARITAVVVVVVHLHTVCTIYGFLIVGGRSVAFARERASIAKSRVGSLGVRSVQLNIPDQSIPSEQDQSLRIVASYSLSYDIRLDTSHARSLTQVRPRAESLIAPGARSRLAYARYFFPYT